MTFIDKFVEKCQQLQIDPPRSVIDLINRKASSPHSHKHTLNLTGHNLSQKLCAALGYALKDDSFYDRVIIGDAFLGDDGTIHLANSLKPNDTVVHLDLRGNNIRADGATAVSQLLKVNNTIKTISLEWNCIGIWETGTRAIADALTANQSLEDLDLRNNKIGPQGIQSIAIALKHNTNLKRLDLRWNNAGLIGGRALVTMLKWNNTLIELDLTGNEIPEDVAKSIALSIERNRDKFKLDEDHRSHSTHLQSTIQALTQTHQEALRSYTSKYHDSEATRSTLASQLEKAVTEIKDLGAAKRHLEGKLDQTSRDKQALEELLVDERKSHNQKIDILQKDVIAAREGRLRSDEAHSKQLSDANKKGLEFEAKYSDAIVQLEVLKKDKKQFLDELNNAKDREKNLVQVWEDKLRKAQLTFESRLSDLETKKDIELNDKVKKAEERQRTAEEALENEKTRFQTRKAQLEQKYTDFETKSRRELDEARKEYEQQLQQLRSQRDALQNQLTVQSHTHAKDLLELETSLIKKSGEARESQQKELEASQAKVNSLGVANASLTTQLNEANEKYTKERLKREEQVSNMERDFNAKFDREVIIWKTNVEKTEAEARRKENEIAELRNTIRSLEMEMDERDDMHRDKMNDLGNAINSLMSSRTSIERNSRRHSPTRRL